MRCVALIFFFIVGCGASQRQVQDLLDANVEQAKAFADRARFDKTLYEKHYRKATPGAQQEFWKGVIESGQENVSDFERANQQVIRLALASRELDPEQRQRYVEQLTQLIILAKTGELPTPDAGTITPTEGE